MAGRKEFCKKLREAVDDEARATKEYRQMGKESGSKEIDIVFTKLSQDEASHREALSKIANLSCSTRAYKRGREISQMRRKAGSLPKHDRVVLKMRRKKGRVPKY